MQFGRHDCKVINVVNLTAVLDVFNMVNLKSHTVPRMLGFDLSKPLAKTLS